MKARQQTSFLFDLDGTLVDSVYDHVLAWHDALQEEGIEVSVWRLHRKIGMSGGLFTKALARETGHEFGPEMLEKLRLLHLKYYSSRSHRTRPLPGARELLAYLSDNGIPWAIATSGRIETAGPVLKILGVDPAQNVVITRDLVRYAKPDPDLFLAAAEKLDVRHRHGLRGGRRDLGHAGGTAGARTGHRPPLRRLWHGRTRTRRRLPRL